MWPNMYMFMYINPKLWTWIEIKDFVYSILVDKNTLQEKCGYYTSIIIYIYAPELERRTFEISIKPHI